MSAYLDSSIARFGDPDHDYCITDEADMADLSERTLSAFATKDTEVARLKEALREILPYAEDHVDCGPSGEGWQSDELIGKIARARKALEEL